MTVQESVAGVPLAIDPGVAVKLEITGGENRTATVVAAVAVPPAPAAVSV